MSLPSKATEFLHILMCKCKEDPLSNHKNLSELVALDLAMEVVGGATPELQPPKSNKKSNHHKSKPCGTRIASRIYEFLESNL